MAPQRSSPPFYSQRFPAAAADWPSAADGPPVHHTPRTTIGREMSCERGARGAAGRDWKAPPSHAAGPVAGAGLKSCSGFHFLTAAAPPARRLIGYRRSHDPAASPRRQFAPRNQTLSSPSGLRPRCRRLGRVLSRPLRRARVRELVFNRLFSSIFRKMLTKKISGYVSARPAGDRPLAASDHVTRTRRLNTFFFIPVGFFPAFFPQNARVTSQCIDSHRTTGRLRIKTKGEEIDHIRPVRCCSTH
ncbi:uncharacterized protein LOC127585963 [Pristis pectinata]|uniref:uncharacterized protein LOC127585963 n=1 Tax=Pristis pectinata TaxID=685728 RepID=UPI00223CE7B1|nr:uncharacterized protein LOC127585963 [Pristis pectinata]